MSDNLRNLGDRILNARNRGAMPEGIAPYELTLLMKNGIAISMDGKGRFLDNIFIERLWRSLKYEEIFLKAYGSVTEARLGIKAWIKFYNDDRKHQALGYWTPLEIFAASIACGYVHNASALSTYPQAPQSQTEKDSINAVEVIPSDTKLLAA